MFRGIFGAKCTEQWRDICRKEKAYIIYEEIHTSSSKGYAAMGRQMVKTAGIHSRFYKKSRGNAKAIDPADVQVSGSLPGSMNLGK